MLPAGWGLSPVPSARSQARGIRGEQGWRAYLPQPPGAGPRGTRGAGRQGGAGSRSTHPQDKFPPWGHDSNQPQGSPSRAGRGWGGQAVSTGHPQRPSRVQSGERCCDTDTGWLGATGQPCPSWNGQLGDTKEPKVLGGKHGEERPSSPCRRRSGDELGLLRPQWIPPTLPPLPNTRFLARHRAEILYNPIYVELPEQTDPHRQRVN